MNSEISSGIICVFLKVWSKNEKSINPEYLIGVMLNLAEDSIQMVPIMESGVL